jgi:hypothetical protein
MSFIHRRVLTTACLMVLMILALALEESASANGVSLVQKEGQRVANVSRWVQLTQLTCSSTSLAITALRDQHHTKLTIRKSTGTFSIVCRSITRSLLRLRLRTAKELRIEILICLTILAQVSGGSERHYQPKQERNVGCNWF